MCVVLSFFLPDGVLADLFANLSLSTSPVQVRHVVMSPGERNKCHSTRTTALHTINGLRHTHKHTHTCEDSSSLIFRSSSTCSRISALSFTVERGRE